MTTKTTTMALTREQVREEMAQAQWEADNAPRLALLQSIRRAERARDEEIERAAASEQRARQALDALGPELESAEQAAREAAAALAGVKQRRWKFFNAISAAASRTSFAKDRCDTATRLDREKLGELVRPLVAGAVAELDAATRPWQTAERLTPEQLAVIVFAGDTRQRVLDAAVTADDPAGEAERVMREARPELRRLVAVAWGNAPDEPGVPGRGLLARAASAVASMVGL